MTSAAGAPREQDHPRAVLARLWTVHRPTNVERVELLERVTGAMLAGRDVPEDRDAGRGAAHKLAGSLGTFGFGDGTTAARAAEAELERPRPDLRVLSEAVQQLRECLEHATVDAVTSSDEPVDDQVPGRFADADDTDDPSRPHLALVTADQELATSLAVDAAAGGLVLTVCDPTEPWPSSVYDGTTDVIVLDAADLLTAVVVERTAAELAAPPAVVVLGAEDGAAHRVAAARGGADAYVWRRTSTRRIVSFLGRLVRERRRVPVSLVALAPDASVEGGWRVRSGDALVGAVHLARRVDEVAELLATVAVDAVVVDDGVRPEDLRVLARLVRGNPAWHLVPIVVLVDDDAAARASAFAAGADDVVRSAAPADELAQRVAATAARARRSRAAAELDPLTDVPNRDQAEAALEQLLRSAELDSTPATIALIDVDRLADVNARYGEAAGDLVLHELGGLLKQSFRDEDVIGRWGPDEFVVGLAGIGAEAAAERLRALFARFDALVGRAERVEGVTFSAGLATFPDDGRRSARLLAAAAARMRTAQVRGAQIVGAGDERPGVVDVVVVEDDVVIADVVSMALRQRGLEVRVIPDGAAAAEALGAGLVRARLVLLDIGLPGLDGFGVLQVLRERGVLRTTKVVVLTARTTETETLRALGLGAVDHISKPFSLPILVRRIRSALAG